MNMRFLLVMAAVLLVLPVAAFAQTVTGEIETTPFLSLVLTTQTPYPAEPGNTVNMEVELQNKGTTAKDITLEMVMNEPFSLLPGEEQSKTFTSIQSGSSVKTSYNIFVATDAITNTYEMEFRLYEGSQRTTYITRSVNLYVRGTPELVLVSMTTDGTLEPNGQANITTVVKNIGTGTARHLTMEFASTDELIPVLSGGNVYVGDLEAGGSASTSMLISIDSSAEQKTYTSTITASFLDESNDKQTKEFEIGLPVSGTIHLDVIKTEPDYSRGKLKIEVANKGTVEAKSVEAKLMVDGKMVDVEYVSSIKANKKATFTFPLALKGDGKLEIAYIGPGLEKNMDVKDIALNFDMPTGDATGTYVIVFIVIVVVFYYFWRKRKKKKKGEMY
ncbi:MAG: CARDB domain-containing protein [Candidatus Aenigmarchaeota archaeon]